jgi:diazepam-binding inhibitor (GABA receptor modulating acyl-CoA-binding protein)
MNNSSIPPHYSDRYINQRYNKALYIVQHLPNSSNVQPTKEQKLEVSCDDKKRIAYSQN